MIKLLLGLIKYFLKDTLDLIDLSPKFLVASTLGRVQLAL
jgi:hypothetical protein